MTQHVLITGGAGFIGRNLAGVLEAAGHRVTRLDDLSVEPVVRPPAELVRRDVRDLTAADLESFDSVVHLACYKSVPGSFESQGSLTHNIDADHHVLRAFASAGRPGRLLMASSCEVYGDQPDACAESRPHEPRSPYAVGKVATEHLASVYRQLHPRREIGVLRFFNTYGADEGADAVIPRFVDLVAQSRSITIEGDGSQARDFSHVSDVCRMVATVLLDEGPVPPVLNIGSGVATSVEELYRRLAPLGGGLPAERVAARPNEIARFVADMGLYERRYGPVLRRDLGPALVEVYRERVALTRQPVTAGAAAGGGRV